MWQGLNMGTEFYKAVFSFFGVMPEHVTRPVNPVSTKENVFAEKSLSASRKLSTKKMPSDKELLSQSAVNFHNYIEGRDWHSDSLVNAKNLERLLSSIFSSFSKAKLILPSPTMPEYDLIALRIGLEVEWLPSKFAERWKITPDQLDEKCKSGYIKEQKLLMLDNPVYPTGQVYTAQELLELAKVLRRHNVIVIHNESNNLFNFNQNSAYLEHYYPDSIINVTCLPDVLNESQYDVCFAHFGKKLNELKIKVSDWININGCQLDDRTITAATRNYLRLAEAKDLLDKQRELLEELAFHVTSILEKENVKVWPSQGGFSLFLEFSDYADVFSGIGIKHSIHLVREINKHTGLNLLAGKLLGMPDNSFTVACTFGELKKQQLTDQDARSELTQTILSQLLELCNWLKQ